MIRINLLPVRAAKKKESIRFQTTIAIMITGLFFTLAIFLYVIYLFDVQSINEEISIVQESNAKVMQKIGKLSKIKEEKARVQEKLNVVDRLEAGRSGPVELLTKVASAIPEMATLQTLTEKKGLILVKGYAADKEVVADFMRKLKAADKRWNAELGQMKTSKNDGQESVAFDLKISIKEDK